MVKGSVIRAKSKIISIQSRLVCGYVGNNIAELAVQLHGLDVISFPTVLFSTHTGISRIYGSTLSKELFDELIDGIKAIDVVKDVANIITGYIGTPEIVHSSALLIKEMKETYPDLLYICDPVMGDFDQGMYVSEAVADALYTQLIPLSDIITPNHYELKRLLKIEENTISAIIEGLKKDPLLVSKKIVATGCILEDTPAGSIESILIVDGQIHRVPSHKVDLAMVGAGDLFTAVVAAQMARGKDLFDAVSVASDILYKALIYSKEHNKNEMNSQCLLQLIK